MRSMARKALRINAANVRALLESILIVKNYSVLKNLRTQKWRAGFKVDEIDWPRQNLKQVPQASKKPIAWKSLDSKIEVGMNGRRSAFC